MYEDSKNSLKNIVEWLGSSDEDGWEGQLEHGEAAREDLERMARPDYHRGRGRGFQGPQNDPNANRLNKAIPHVRAMLKAMQDKNREAALEQGKLAIAMM